MTDQPPLPTIPPAPAVHAFAVTPSDSATFPTACRALWIGGAGNVAVLALADSDAVTFSAVPAGTLLPIVAQQVLAAGTTATDIVGLW